LAAGDGDVWRFAERSLFFSLLAGKRPFETGSIMTASATTHSIRCAFTVDFDRKEMGYSPDRVDALVWALTELMIEGGARRRLLFV
jgi:hypothetical protein